MEEKKLYRMEAVLSSTHIDSHGDMLTKEALEMAANTINSKRKPRLGLEHDMTYPPMGRITDAKVVQGPDKAYYLVAIKEYYDTRKQIRLSDGSVLIKEMFSLGGTPFAEVNLEPSNKIVISVDKNNFSSFEEIKKFYDEVQHEVVLPFNKMQLMRKSALTDPEVIITIAKAYLFGKLIPKVADKVTEKIGEDVAKLYDLIKVTAKKIVKFSEPKNHPISCILESPGKPHLELIIKTDKPDIVAIAFTGEKMKNIEEKIESMVEFFDAEKIQFIFNDKQEWELNYMLTANGEVIGTPESFGKRDKAFKELAEKMMDKKKKDDEKENKAHN